MTVAATTSSLIAIFLMTTFGWLQQTSEEDLSGKLQQHVEEIQQTINESDAAKDATTGILDPIYQLAEYVSFPAFYWIAFALMVAGVVSFAFQLVLGKFFLLFKSSFNVKEILSDLLGLIISLIGLILTTQAATQNSSFPENPTLVLSATIVGAITGLVFYWWGQTQEFRAVAKTATEKKE